MAAGRLAGRRTVKNLVKEFKADRVKNANVIVDVMERLESNDVGTKLSAVTGLHHIFTFLLRERGFEKPTKAEGGSTTANKTVRKWFIEMLAESIKLFLQHLQHSERAVQELCLSSLLKLMQCEARYPIKKSSGYGFPLGRLKAVVTVLMSEDVDHRNLIGMLQEYLECQDFMFYTLLAVTEVVKTHTRTHTDKSVSVAYMNNLVAFVERIKIPPADSPPPLLPPQLFLHPPDQDDSDIGEDEEGAPKFTLDYTTARRSLNIVWPTLLQYPLTPDLYRRVLVALPDLAMPHLEKPLALTGFLMESYNMGGAISLLALQGVFILINKHNLDYPDFYKRLYALLDPNIFHTKYRARFFMLCDRFLSSTHLPEYLVASFVKRLARLSLHAPSPCLPLLTKFIVNLLIRCPGLHRLIHNPASNVEEDPFLPEEEEPACTRAGESSLWEIASLHSHILPSVSRAAAFTQRHSLPQWEADLGEWVELWYEELYTKASKGGVKEGVATTFIKPEGVFQHREDTMADWWCLLPQHHLGTHTGSPPSVSVVQ